MTRKWFWSASVALFGTLVLPIDTLAQAGLGSEFQVNTFTSGSQYYPTVAISADGDFVVAWASYDQDGSGNGVFAQLFSSAGVAVGGELQVNTHFTSAQTAPAVASSADGGFVVVWMSEDQDGYLFGVFARLFSSAGVALDGEFQVNSYTTFGQLYPSVSAAADGDFVIAWASGGQDGAGGGIFARGFTSAGVALGAEFQVSTYTASHQTVPAVAVDADGDFVVAWESGGQDGPVNGFYGIFVRRFSSAGSALGGELQVNTYTPSSQRAPAVAADADGDFVVAWQSSAGQDGSFNGIFAQRFSSAGIALGQEFQVNTYTSSSQFDPSVALDADADFVISWASSGQDGSGSGVFGRGFSKAGVALASELQVSTYTSSVQQMPSVAARAGGDFVVAWASNGQDGPVGGFYGIFGRRFSAPPSTATLDVDADGETDALTDGLLVLRFQFGFTGAALTNGAVGDDCMRCDANEIESYLGGLGLTLDVDDDGALAALTDGLLVVRFLFGFTGASLTSGAVGDDCDARCDAAAIEGFLGGLS